MNRIVLTPIFPESLARVEANVLGDTTGVYAAIYGRAEDVPENLTWDRPHVLLDASGNVIMLRTLTRDAFGISGANGASVEVLARSGDNTVDMASRQLNTAYTQAGVYAYGVGRVSMSAPLGENRVTVATHDTGKDGALWGFTSGVMVFNQGEAYLTGKGNLVTVESSFEPNVTDLTAGVAIHEEGTVHLRATETGNTVTVRGQNGVGLSIEPTLKGRRSVAAMTLEALGEADNVMRS